MSVDLLTSGDIAIPHPRRRVPLLGDVLGVHVRTPLQDSMRMAAELGPIFERKVLGRRFVLVSDPDIVAELSDESRFRKHLAPAVAALRPIAGDGLFTAFSDEPNWQRAHNLLAPAFTKPAMRSYHEIMTDVAEELTAHLDSSARTPVDVSSAMTKLTLETIGRTGFSFRFDSFDRDRPHPFVEAMVRALGHAQRDVTPMGRFVGRRARARHAADVAYLGEVVDEVIRVRRERPQDGPSDLLEIMLRAQRELDPERVDEVNIRHQVITFLVAGHETTSGALSFALYYLSRHPEALARAQAEVDEVWGAHDRPAFEQVPKLRYVRRVLDESLRLWPTAPAYAREARADTTLLGRHRMSAGDWMLVLIPALHRDPVWGEDADAFDPDRFLSERVRARPAHVYKPFGTGERACIGRQFALHEAVLVLGTLLRRYDLHADPGYRLRVQERLTLMPKGFTLEFTRRADRA
ncbi:cytochrome P450 [Rhodococcus sp. D2-41]|uniref:cytochrome P450 n=1 Tax=Speluncibacter jeojiensis TaxID=2710754 RepID=UPI0024102658|nr:cytochrome P450 [Rhodococcus sp. D2-41]MDG3011481.1 cytochrome P450 [Rhodococcus sp. D2-41]